MGPGVEAVIVAKWESTRIRKLNAPTTQVNRRIIAENVKIDELNKGIVAHNIRVRASGTKDGFRKRIPRKPLLRLPNVMAREHLEVLDRERRRAGILESRTPEQWAEVIKVVPEPARTRVACLVWYDYFGDQPVPERWPHLDEYLKRKYEPVPRNEVLEGLVQVGYSEYSAHIRSSMGVT